MNTASVAPQINTVYCQIQCLDQVPFTGIFAQRLCSKSSASHISSCRRISGGNVSVIDIKSKKLHSALKPECSWQSWMKSSMGRGCNQSCTTCTEGHRRNRRPDLSMIQREASDGMREKQTHASEAKAPSLLPPSADIICSTS